MFGAGAAHAEEVVYVWNWADYIGETTLADFTKETGIKVVYDTYDSPETVQAKMQAGSTGYDVVIHSASSYGQAMIKGKMVQTLDKAKIPNITGLDPKLVADYDAYDPGLAYSVPYMWGTTGFTYNVDMIKERMPDAPLDSADMLFNPEVVKKFADCGVSFLDSPADVIPMALAYLGLDPNSENPADYAKVEEMLKKVRPYIRTFDSAEYLTTLPNKSMCIAMNWSGDYATASTRAAEAGVQVNLAYTIPKTGGGLWFDAMFIPSDAKHKANAEKFINFMLRPDVIAKSTDFTNYANAVTAATALSNPEVTGNPAIYPDAETMKRCFGLKTLPGKVMRILTRTFSNFKTAS